MIENSEVHYFPPETTKAWEGRLQERMEKGGGNGHNGGMDLISYRLDQLEKRADKTDAKLDKLVDTVNAMNNNLTSSTESLKGRLDLIEKKLPNWWQPYAGVGAISVLLAAMVALARVIFH